MIDPKPLPSRQLRLVARTARWLLGLVLALWLMLIASWSLLHGIIVPRIGEWRGEVESMASQALGTGVAIGALSASSSGIFPTFELTQVVLSDPQGRSELTLPRVVLALSPQSVLRLGIEQLRIDGPELEVRRLADGRWQVAGIEVPDGQGGEDSPLVKWLLAQPEVAITQGQVHFTDELRRQPRLSLQQVELLLHGGHWKHALSLAATHEQGQRLKVTGNFREPLLPSAEPAWRRWQGQWYAEAQIESLPPLPWAQALGIDGLDGQGQARAWVDVRRGQPRSATVDLALASAQVRWTRPALQPLQLQQLQGRLTLQRQGQTWQLQGQQLGFGFADGRQWPRSDFTLSAEETAGTLERLQLSLNYADAAMAASLAARLPLPDHLQQPLASLAPQGELHQWQLDWTPNSYSSSGRFQGLALASEPAPSAEQVGRPGFSGLQGSFELNQSGGQARVQMADGELSFPGVFEEPNIPIDRLQAALRWEVQPDDAFSLEISDTRFANADAAGELQASWRTGDEAEHRLPGVLALKGSLSRANGARVHRYLPLEVPESARHYVRDSVHQGSASQVSFEVRGDLRHMPFDEPGTGLFRIRAPVREVVYEFVPTRLREPGQAAWPALTRLHGELLFEGSSMQVIGAATGFVGHPQLQMKQVNARIAQFHQPLLEVEVAGQSPLSAMLRLVAGSPLAQMTGQALAQAEGEGRAGLEFRLELPIDHPEQTRVQGRVLFQGNTLRFSPEVPLLRQTRGAVRFHDHGFALEQVQALALGGAVQLQGGMDSSQTKPGAPEVQIQAQGMASGQGLRDEAPLALVRQIARFAQGQAAYSVEVAVHDGQPDVIVQSSLQGLSLDLPAPLGKPAEATQPLRVALLQRADGLQDLQVQLPGRGQVGYLRDTRVEPARVVSGEIVLGERPAAAPAAAGVQAWVQLAQLDLDAWQATWAGQTDAQAAGAELDQALDYLPTQLQLSVDRLLVQQRQLLDVRAGVSEHAGVWRGKLQAQQFGGYVEYRPPSVQHASGLVFARLQHLTLPDSEVQRLEAASAPGSAADSPLDSLPALDVQVDALEIAGKSLGRLELQAHNRPGPAGREWILSRFNLATPEAHWQAEGRWAAPALGERRHTQLNFSLNMDDVGGLLQRFGMPGVIRDGQGALSGEIDWVGAPVAPDWLSMDGAVHLEVGKGQFLKAEPGMAKLLSVLSLQSLARRINLDFRDIFSQGFAFDFIRGDVLIRQGVARTNNLQMKGLNAAVLMEGQASLIHETQDLRVLVVPEINAMTASLVATAINPVIGLGSFVAQFFLRGPLMEAATRAFHVSGTWSDPVVEAVKPGAARPSAARPDAARPDAARPTPTLPLEPDLSPLVHLGG